MTTYSKYKLKVKISSCNHDYSKTLEFHTIPSLTDCTPNDVVPRNKLKIPKNIRLADPQFYQPGPVDMLLGTGPTYDCYSVGKIKLSENNQDLFLINTRFGWIIGGILEEKLDLNLETCFLSNVEFNLNKFWELEEFPQKSFYSPEEQQCEKFFEDNITRDKTGKFVTALPFKNDKSTLGESLNIAFKCFKHLQKRFLKDPEFYQQYKKIIDEYLEMGHMTISLETPFKNYNKSRYFLPHHAVKKQDSLTTKVRIVFNASSKTSSGKSLNDILHKGPKLQKDVHELLNRFRMHEIVLLGDIEKMYRMFWVRPEDRKYQSILWEIDGKLAILELNTIVFGEGPGPYLAIKCLNTLASIYKKEFPVASERIINDMYIDDLITGGETVEEVRLIRNQISEMLESTGLNMRKWASNNVKVLDDIVKDDEESVFFIQKDEKLKTLGVGWNSQKDLIFYTVQPPVLDKKLTKRIILSDIAKIYDPLGLLGPVILYAKRIMQQIWQLKLHWDEVVPSNISFTWTKFVKQMNFLNNITFARKVVASNFTNIQFHGFCDASEAGYGACLYVKTSDKSNNHFTSLICAKSRVAPIKTVSLPRLELCGALLLARLYSETMKHLSIFMNNKHNVQIENPVFWCDSTITLQWINRDPSSLKCFEANRVSEIHSKTKNVFWRHVPSEHNPADALSRGQLPKDFIENNQWKCGPDWLIQNSECWPYREIPNNTSDLPGLKKEVCLLIEDFKLGEFIFPEFSSFSKLLRVTARILRWLKNNKYEGFIRASEIKDAELRVVRVIQKSRFGKEIRHLSRKGKISNKSSLIHFCPFLDKQNILRVGGRLQKSHLSYSQKHPILLPQKHPITDLIIKHYHELYLHTGIMNTLNAIREQYWVINGRDQVQKIIRKCIRCFHFNPPDTNCVMGNLPEERLIPARPFSRVGVDFCGPFWIKEKKYRNRNKLKVYVCVFVCLFVKAVHLEVVEDLTTESFIATFENFISRRGYPEIIMSDNGTNFVGANRQLNELYEFLNKESAQNEITNFFTERKIEWKFIPPLSPNFGGLWESSVKAFKHHLKRIMADVLFTYKEFETMVIKIESVLKSRPISALSNDPNDLQALTPSILLNCDPLKALPERNLLDTPNNRLTHWELITKLRQHFWERWNKEYLNQLNVRQKWTTGVPSIKINTLVILKDKQTSTMKWPLGRITEVFPDNDGVIRTVMVKTAKGVYKRNVRTVAPLPLNENITNLLQN